MNIAAVHASPIPDSSVTVVHTEQEHYWKYERSEISLQKQNM